MNKQKNKNKEYKFVNIQIMKKARGLWAGAIRK